MVPIRLATATDRIELAGKGDDGVTPDQDNRLTVMPGVSRLKRLSMGFGHLGSHEVRLPSCLAAVDAAVTRKNRHVPAKGLREWGIALRRKKYGLE